MSSSDERVVGLLDDELVELLGVGQLGAEILEHGDVVVDRAELRRHLPGLIGVVPQVGPGHLGLELGPTRPQALQAQIALGLLESLPQRRQLAPEVALLARSRRAQTAPWQSLNFLPLPHQHGSLRPSFSVGAFTRGAWVSSSA